MVATPHQQSFGFLNLSEEQDGLFLHRRQTSQHLSTELAWKDYFRDPTQWWDNRNTKVGHAYPDFKHKVTQEPLWLDSRKSPSWVFEELRRRGTEVSTQTRTVKPCVMEKNAIHDKTYLHNDEVGSFRASLKACAKSKDLFQGTRIHDDLTKKGLVVKCSDALVTMYAKCGALVKAKELLDIHKSRNVSSWTALILGYARRGQSQDALMCYECMQDEGLSPNAITLSCILKVCGSLKAAEKGKQIHDEIVRQDFLENDVILGTALIDMYAKCGALEKAHRVLQEMPSRNVVSWSALIAGCAQLGQAEQALACYKSMRREGLPPDAMTFASVLKACGIQGALVEGEQIHDEISTQGLLANDFVLGTALVDMYAKCGALPKAQNVLEELPSRDIGTWNALIAGYTQHGQCEEALKCSEQMQGDGLFPDMVTFVLVLKACGILGAADKGEQFEAEIKRRGLLSSSSSSSIALGTALVDMYVRCGALSKAACVFEELPSRTLLSWNLLITGYIQYGQGVQALTCYERMLSEGVSPDPITFACILKACGSIKALEKGKQIHDEIANQGLLGRNIVLGNALVDFYAKCGALSDAHLVLEELPLRDTVSWSALIAGYAEQGQGEKALKCFENMQREGLSPNAVTYTCTLKACGSIGAIEEGEKIHDTITKEGLLGTDVVLGNALVDMYAKCGALVKAQEVLKKLPSRDVSSWNAIIAGYAQQGQNEQALNCLEQMQCEGFFPDAVTFSCMLNACSHLGLVEDCRMYFGIMCTKYGVKPDVEHYTCMVDLFGRAGHLEKAVEVIQGMPSSDSSAVWRVLLGACKEWGNANVGRWAFEQAVRLEKSDGTAYTLMANMHARG